jgi:hypothetical protein
MDKQTFKVTKMYALCGNAAIAIESCIKAFNLKQATELANELTTADSVTVEVMS